MVEIVPKPIAKIPLWQNVLFYFVIVLVVGSIASYFILNYFQQKASENLEDVKTLLAEDKTLEEIDALEKEIFGHRKKIRDFSKIFNSHQYNSNSFTFIESLTHPKVMWSTFNLNTKTLTVSLSGQTQNFQTLGQQMLILKQEELINKIDLSDIRLEKEGKIGFKVNFTFDSKILK